MEKIIFEKMSEEDLPMIWQWLAQPHIEKWWKEADDYNVFADLYRSKMHSDEVFPFIIYLDGKPIGFIQYYLTDKINNGWWLQHIDWPEKTAGVDLFIGLKDYIGKGYGTILLKQFIDEYVLKHPDISTVILDPQPTNLGAIRCYQKVGFTEVKHVITPDGPALMMKLTQSGT